MRFENILEWYSGKARDSIVNSVIPVLVECEELGYWKKGVSRTMKAALNKQTVAQKFSRSLDEQLGEIDRYGSGQKRLAYDHPLHAAASDMRYGAYDRAPKHLLPESKAKREVQGIFSFTTKAGTVNANETIERWAQAFAPVYELIALLDSRRPKPVIVMKTLSHTVAKTVSAHIGLDVSTIQSPAMHGEWVEFLYKGQKVRVWEVVIDWPEGTLHNKSRFWYSKRGNSQCEACGHAIKDPYNWVPILSYDAAKTPYSLWVGRDCAEKLFGCEVEGDAIYKREGSSS